MLIRPAVRTGRQLRGGVTANTEARSSASSSVSTGMAPAASMAARVIAPVVVMAPVWPSAAPRPASERPIATTITGVLLARHFWTASTKCG